MEGHGARINGLIKGVTGVVIPIDGITTLLIAGFWAHLCEYHQPGMAIRHQFLIQQYFQLLSPLQKYRGPPCINTVFICFQASWRPSSTSQSSKDSWRPSTAILLCLFKVMLCPFYYDKSP